MELLAHMDVPRVFLHHTKDERPDPSSFLSHCHDAYEIIYVAQGKGRYIVEGKEYRMSPNTLLLLPPHSFHYVEPSADTAYERYVFHFRENSLPEEGRGLLKPFGCGEKEREGENGMSPGKVHFYSSELLPSHIGAIFARMDAVELLPKSQRAQFAGMLLAETLMLLAVTSPAESATNGEPLGEQIAHYLHAHLTEPMSLDKLSSRFYVSKFYLCRVFKEHNGASILRYVTEKRVFLAKQYLEEGDTAVSAAARAGFGDYSSFFRAYKKIIGSAPKQEKDKRERPE
ncbi:MAG: AraC family transcriptional regulator [Clostridia bacterium]|nr:AraC family transcriptional regulator [Clostridia bacterium]